MITLLLVLALNGVDYFDPDTGRAAPYCQVLGDALAGCVAYHGPTVCQAYVIWMCTAGGEEANVGLVAHPFTWPPEWQGQPPQ